MNIEMANLLTKKFALETDEAFLKHQREIVLTDQAIREYQANCPHDDALVIREGKEFDGYDRNEYFAIVECQHCGVQGTRTRPWHSFYGKPLADLPRKEGLKFEYI